MTIAARGLTAREPATYGPSAGGSGFEHRLRARSARGNTAKVLWQLTAGDWARAVEGRSDADRRTTAAESVARRGYRLRLVRGRVACVIYGDLERELVVADADLVGIVQRCCGTDPLVVRPATNAMGPAPDLKSEAPGPKIPVIAYSLASLQDSLDIAFGERGDGHEGVAAQVARKQ
jgi:hypothetical protein